MRDHSLIILVLLGHIIGDFYGQTNKMAERKETCFRTVLLHGLVYALCMGLTLWAGIHGSVALLRFAGLLGGIHLTIDLLKYLFVHITKENALYGIKKNLFILNQCAHLLSLAVILWIWDAPLVCRPYLSQPFTRLSAPPLTLLFGFLCILRPVAILVEKGKILEPFKPTDTAEGTHSKKDKEKNPGRVIGYLERTIVFFFLLHKEYSAIAFVLTAKSIARFEQAKEKAEYYLIGTLFSVASAFMIFFLLGLFE